MEEISMNKNKPNVWIKYGLTLITIVILLLIFTAVDLPALLSVILSLGIAFFLFRQMNKMPKKNPNFKKVTPEKERFYQSKGLSKEDIDFFRETMQQAKEQILSIESNMRKSSKLKAIEKRNNTVNLSKLLFKSITEHPDRLHQVDQFLYVHLPALSDLTKKFVEIKNHQAKSKATYDILQKSAVTIDDMCEQIATDYVKFKSEDLEDMDMKVELAKQTIDKDNDNTDNSIDQEEI